MSIPDTSLMGNVKLQHAVIRKESGTVSSQT